MADREPQSMRPRQLLDPSDLGGRAPHPCRDLRARISEIRDSPNSFRVAWVERRYENGSLSGTERWTAILTTVLQPPSDADKLRKNPLGNYVTAINWSKELGQ